MDEGNDHYWLLKSLALEKGWWGLGLKLSLKLMQHPLGPSLILASSMVDRYVALRLLSHCQHPSMHVLCSTAFSISSWVILALAFTVRPEYERINIPRSNPQQRGGNCLLFSGWPFLRCSACFSGGFSGIANVHFHCFFFLSCVSGCALSLLLPQIISQKASCIQVLAPDSTSEKQTRAETL